MKSAISGLVLATAGLSIAPADAQQAARSAPVDRIAVHNSVLRIPAGGPFPITKSVQVGVSKSLMVQFQTRLRDVLVSDPERVDAVVQSADRVFLLAKKAGQVNAFFFDENGDQVLTLEITVGVDLSALDDLLRRMLPGSSIRSEIAGNAIILNGSVANPVQSQRAATIATQYAKANQSTLFSGSSGSSATAASTTPSGGSTPASTQTQAASGDSKSGGGGDEKLVINLLSIEAEEQVMLQVVVAEVQRSIMKQFGINLGAAINSGNFATTLLTDNALPLTAAAGLGKLPIPGLGTEGLDPTKGATCLTMGVLCNWNQGPAGATYGNSGLSGGYSAGGNRMSYALRMLERDGLVRTLAEPNLTAVSGETAKFLAGGEYPVPVVDTTGRLSVTFKQFGIGVAFTPLVLSEGRISLKIETEVSELTDVGSVTLSSFSIPALRKRQANSTVELPSGGTLALAGLLSEDTRKNIDGFPGLKDLPILGTLFRSNDFIKRETELVVMVTPYMVRPVARQKLAKPDDGLAAASDLKFNLLGHLNRVYGKGTQPPPNGGLKDSIGFIID